jgi:putative endopeptidase
MLQGFQQYLVLAGSASNLEEFYNAFDCKKGDKLWREPGERVKIW